MGHGVKSALPNTLPKSYFLRVFLAENITRTSNVFVEKAKTTGSNLYRVAKKKICIQDIFPPFKKCISKCTRISLS